jgi:hypothetical protein
MNNDQPTWIISMLNAQTGQQQYFSSLHGLVQFFTDEFGSDEEGEIDSQPAVQDHENPLGRKPGNDQP